MTQFDSSKMSKFHITQISYLQQSIWDLEKARVNITTAIGASDLGKCYVNDINELIESIRDDINNIHDEYAEEDV